MKALYWSSPRPAKVITQDLKIEKVSTDEGSWKDANYRKKRDKNFFDKNKFAKDAKYIEARDTNDFSKDEFSKDTERWGQRDEKLRTDKKSWEDTKY